jgi:transcriptional regulator with XRE-family HTH domain
LVGVSGQAVSKWENDQSYPDITLLPTVATILNTDINYLFGMKKEEVIIENSFPTMYEGLPLVHNTLAVACYSDKTVEKKDETGVKFTDGSSAELSSRLAVNAGMGEIRFLCAQEAWEVKTAQPEEDDTGIVTQEFEFGYIDNLDIAVLANDCEIIRSADDKTRVRATLESRLMKRLRVGGERKRPFHFL